MGPVGRTAERVVNTGFTAQDDPDTPMDKMTPLAENTDYYFWMEIGKPVKGSIETTPTDIPVVPEHAQLVVVVFGFRNGIKTKERANVGKPKSCRQAG